MDWTAVRLTLQLAIGTTLILSLAGLPLSWWLARSSSRFRGLIQAVVATPLVLPPTVFGFYLLLLTGPRSLVGKTYLQLTGSTLPFSFTGILLASVLFNVPFAVQPFTAAFRRVDSSLLEASWCLGASRWRTFWKVAMPLSWPGLLAGMTLTFAHCLGEFGVILMVGGNIPGLTKTLSIAIYDDVQALDYAAAHQQSALLVTFAVVSLAFAHWLGRERT